MYIRLQPLFPSQLLFFIPEFKLVLDSITKEQHIINIYFLSCWKCDHVFKLQRCIRVSKRPHDSQSLFKNCWIIVINSN